MFIILDTFTGEYDRATSMEWTNLRNNEPGRYLIIGGVI